MARASLSASLAVTAGCFGILVSSVVAADTPAKKTTPAKPATTSIIPAFLLGGATKAGKTPAQKRAEELGTHKESASVKVRTSDGKYGLQTLCVAPDGNVLALAAPPRSYGAPSKDAFSEVHVFSPEGKAITHWKVDFHAHSINTAPDGTVYVAGSGKVAKFDKKGKSLGNHELPHLKELLSNKSAMRKEAEAELKQQKESFSRIVDTYKQRAEDLKKIDVSKRTELQKRQLAQYESILKSYASTIKFYESRSVDSVIEQKMARLRIINGITISEKEIFIACGESKGYGYAVWRMGLEFKNPKVVLTGLSGCCGQMDIQCCEKGLVVAENTKHQFGLYDRDGKRLSSHGKRGDTTPDGFGGCCNPMNVRACKGEIYTAESEGLIKRFSDDGKFLSVVGYAPLTGGCKNVGVGVSPDGSRVYFTDQPGSRIIIMSRKTTKTE